MEPSDYIENATHHVSYESFERDARGCLTERNEHIEVSPRQMQALFEITDRHLKLETGLRQMHKPMMRRDYDRSNRISAEAIRKLDGLISWAQRYQNQQQPTTAQSQSSTTAGVADSIVKKLLAVRRELEEEFADEGLHVRALEVELRALRLQSSVNEYVMELKLHIDRVFSGLPQTSKNELILACAAGARIVPRREWLKSSENRAAMMVSRAVKHHIEQNCGQETED